MSGIATQAAAPRPRSGRPPAWAAVAAIGAVTLAAAIAGAVVVSPMMAIVALGGGILALGVILRPAVATLVVVAVLYSNAATIAVRFHDVPFFVAAAVPALLIPPLAAFVILERKPIVITSALPWIVVFLFIQLVSGLVSDDKITAWDTIVRSSARPRACTATKPGPPRYSPRSAERSTGSGPR